MMKRSLLIPGLIVSPFVLAGVALAVLFFAVDPDHYRKEIVTAVKQSADADLRMDSHATWAVWPRPGISLGKIALFDKKNKTILIAADEAVIGIGLGPLPSGNITITGLSLNVATASVVRHTDGSNNWDDVLNRLQQNKSPAFDYLSVSKGTLTLNDEKSGTVSDVDNIQLDARSIGAEKGFPLEAAFDISRLDASGGNVLSQNTLKTTIVITSKQKLAFKQTVFTSELSSTHFPGLFNTTVQGDLDADIDQQLVTGRALDIASSYKSMALTGTATAKATSNIRADLNHNTLQMDQLALAASYPLAEQKQNLQLGFATTALINFKHAQLSFQDFKLRADGPEKTSALLSGTLQGNWENGVVAMEKLTVSASVPLRHFPKPVPVNFSGPVQINLAQGHLQLPAFTLDVANMPATGKLDVQLPGLPASLTDRTQIFTGMKASGELKSALFNPRATLVALGITPPKNLAENSLGKAGFALRLEGDEKQIALKNILLTLDDATLVGEATISDFSTPLYSTRYTLNNLELGLLSSHFWSEGRASGRLSGQGQFTTQGDSLESWRKTVSGTSSVKLQDGVLHGVDFMQGLNERLGSYQALLPELAAATPSAAEETRIVTFVAENNVDKGVISTKSLAINFGKARISGSGAFNMQQQIMDYRLQLDLDKSLFADKQKNMELPMQCQGNLAEEQLDFFSALATDCKLAPEGMHDILTQALRKKLRS